MPAETYRLPNFLALLPEKPGGEINRHFKQAETAFNAWVRERLDEHCAARVYDSESPLCVAVIFPLASYKQLKGIIDYVAASFLLDDLLDHSPTEDLTSLGKLWLKILRDGNEGKSVENPIMDILRSDLLSNAKTTMGPFHWSQFIAANESVAMHMVQEAHEQKAFLNNDATLTIQSYFKLRRWTVGTCVSFVLVRATRSLYIPDDVLATPVVQDMEQAATDLTIVSNDIYSFKKERSSDGAFNNILTAIEKDPETAHLDFQGRLDYAAKLFKAALERFNACRLALPSFGPEMDRYLALYADGLMDYTIGNVEWSIVARRYSTFEDDEDRKNNVMRWAPDANSSGDGPGINAILVA